VYEVPIPEKIAIHSCAEDLLCERPNISFSGLIDAICFKLDKKKSELKGKLPDLRELHGRLSE
jgi:hypothetical protein